MELQLLINVKLNPADEDGRKFTRGLSKLTPHDYGSLLLGDLAADITRVAVIGPAADLHT